MSDLFAGIAGQDQTVSFLRRVLDAGTATHAYLIAGGGDGEGLDIALGFAAGLLGGADEDTREQVWRKTHPDLHVYSPGGADGYLVEQVRELTRDAELAPIRATGKVYIIQDAHRLAGAPANAFLKTLEEPPADVTCILVANNEAAVLETLRSRCEVLVLNSSSSAHAGDARVFEMLYALATGCGNQKLLDSSRLFVEIARERAVQDREGDLDTEAYIEKYEDYLSQGAKKQIELAGKRETTARERSSLFELCAVVRAWLRDCLVAYEGTPELLSYPGSAETTSLVGGSAGVAGLVSALDAVRVATSRISYNVTPQLAIDAMFLEIREALCRR